MVDPFGKKTLGQHWLRDDDSLRAMCDAAEVSGRNAVLEIGPGQGALTAFLLKRAKRVVAVEFDEQLASTLQKNLQEHRNAHAEDVPQQRGNYGVVSKLEVVHEDILRFDLSALPAGYKVVANIPYYLTSKLIRMMSESANPPSVAALLVQKEVAERAAAGPGDMSLLSVTAQFYWEVSLGRIVRAELFSPPPKVDSQILIMNRRKDPLFPDVDPKEFFRPAKAGFAQRRKTLLNSLSAGLQLDREETIRLLEHAHIAPATRAQALSLQDWYRLAKLVSETGAVDAL